MKKVALGTFLLACALAFSQDAATDAKERKLLKDAQALYTNAKKAYTAKPTDKKLKKNYIDATVSVGTITMNSPMLEPKVKYAAALRYYREALKLDPKNEVALNNKKMIESIYKSLNRPIPK